MVLSETFACKEKMRRPKIFSRREARNIKLSTWRRVSSRVSRRNNRAASRALRFSTDLRPGKSPISPHFLRERESYSSTPYQNNSNGTYKNASSACSEGHSSEIASRKSPGDSRWSRCDEGTCVEPISPEQDSVIPGTNGATEEDCVRLHEAER